MQGVLVKFKGITHKQDIIKKKNALKNRNDLNSIFSNEDLLDECRKAHQNIRTIKK